MVVLWSLLVVVSVLMVWSGGTLGRNTVFDPSSEHGGIAIAVETHQWLLLL